MKNRKFLSKALLTLLCLTISCSNNEPAKQINQDSKKTSLAVPPPPPPKKVIPQEIKDKVQKYIDENDIFSEIPYQKPSKYAADLTGDGVPIFLTGDGVPIFLTGDGVPIFGIKNEAGSSSYLWNRKPKDLIFDYLQVTNNTEEYWGHTSYARYSQLINHEIKLSSPIAKTKNVELVKTMAFGLTDDNDKLKPYSVTAVEIKPKDNVNAPYHIIGVMMTTKFTKFIFSSDFRLVPLPGISLSKNVGTNEFNLFAEIVFNVKNRPEEKDFAVIASIKGKQFPLYKVYGNIYGNNVVFPELEADKTEGLIIEAIDRNSLESDDEYNGFTYILPLTK